MTEQAAPSNPAVRTHVAAIRKNHLFTLRTIEGVEAKDACKQPFPEAASILWLVGHLAWAYDAITLQGFAGRPASIPESYGKMFGIGSKPNSGGDYPPFEEVRGHHRRAASEAFDHMETWDDAKLGEMFPEGHPGKDFFGGYDGFLKAQCFHEAYHAGQIGLIRRALGLPTAFGG